MHHSSLIAVIFLLALTACAAPRARTQEQRVLFVGNSLTYVGNLPAVFDAVAAASGHRTRSDMIVAGGATLADRVADGSVAKALAATRYDVLILQERGGDLLCGFGPDSCVQARAALKQLAPLARRHGATPVLLGTYQSLPEASAALIRAESDAARQHRMPCVSVANTFLSVRMAEPDLQWLAADGVHPGHDLTLLQAMLLSRHLYNAVPATPALAIDAPSYTSRSGLQPVPRSADAPPPLAETPIGIHYDAATVRRVARSIVSH